MQAGSKAKRRTSGWQGENTTKRAYNKRERSTHDSDEDFGPLGNRNFFPPTSSTGFSQDGTVPEYSTIGPLLAASDGDDGEGLTPTGRHPSASAHMFGGDCSVHENSLYLDTRSSELP